MGIGLFRSNSSSRSSSRRHQIARITMMAVAATRCCTRASASRTVSRHNDFLGRAAWWSIRGTQKTSSCCTKENTDVLTFGVGSNTFLNKPFISANPRTFHFWTRGGARSEQETIAYTDVSDKRQYCKTLLDTYPVAVCSVQGWRDYMEDEFFSGADFVAVFDGHGGKAVSQYLRQNLYASLIASLPVVLHDVSSRQQAFKHDSASVPEGDDQSSTEESTTASSSAATVGSPNASNENGVSPVTTVDDYEAAMQVALDKVDREVQKISHWSFQGSTAVAIWIHEEAPAPLLHDPIDSTAPDVSVSSSCSAVDDNNKAEPHSMPTERQSHQFRQRTLITANVGDSRAVLCRNGTAIELTRDHKPNDPIEHERIYSRGGTVIWHGEVDRHSGEPLPHKGVWRVNGNLALSRAVGDRSERPAVTADPEFSRVPLQALDEFVVLATDGLWDVMSSSDVVAFVRSLAANLERDETLERDEIATLLAQEALRRGSSDNITVVIMWIHSGPRQPKRYWI